MLDKSKILAGVRACINPALSNCQECPYWNMGLRDCSELRLDIVEAIDSGIFAPRPKSLTAKWVPIMRLNKKFGVECVVGYTCSWCEGQQEVMTDYCSHCGARMEKKQ
jgi:hypothetical protein